MKVTEKLTFRFEVKCGVRAGDGDYYRLSELLERQGIDRIAVAGYDVSDLELIHEGDLEISGGIATRVLTFELITFAEVETEKAA